jgi:sugar/nucleoside kinase (ribokinase family)/fructoselysine-6-P-deglycase FrlB-like protein
VAPPHTHLPVPLPAGWPGSAAGPRPVIIVGNLTIDDVIQPDGTSQMGALGGNSVHAVAAALAWTGDVGIVARSGADFPASALGRLRDAGADISGIRRVDGPTVRNWVIYEADGRRSWVYRTPRGRGAEVAPRPCDIPDAWLARQPPPVVHIAAMPLARAAAVAGSVRDRSPDAVILLDTHEDWPPGPAVLAAARAADVFLPSREELAVLLGYDDPARGARELAVRGVRCVVVKLGGDGALVARPGTEPDRVPAFPATVADATGAGDSFCGAFAAGLALGDDPATAARRGCATAAAAIGASGSLRLLDRASLARDLLTGGARRPAPYPAGRGAGPGPLGAPDLPGLADGQAGETDGYDIAVMRREMATIPEVIAGHLADPGGHVTRLAQWLAEQQIRHVYLTGCGDSVFAAMASSLAFRRHSRLEVRAVHALDLARYQVRYLPPASAVIAISVSGKAGRTIEAALQAAAFGHPVVALTNDSGGPLAAAAARILPIDVPMLGSSPGTSTYIGMLCTLLDLALRTSAPGRGGEVRAACGRLPGLAASTLEACDGPAAEVAARMASSRFVSYLGAGPNEATACFGAAKLLEAPQAVALAVNLEEWAHEEYFITRPGDPVVVVAPAGAAHDRAGEILSELDFLHADAVVVSDIEPPGPATHLRLAGSLPEELSPVLAALPLAQVGYHLARQTGKRSYNFPSEQARTEHYATIHRATIGEPA